MTQQTIQRRGKTYVLVEQGEYERLVGSKVGLPPLPEPDAAGRVDAVEYARASIARDVIRRREAAGMSQTDLARAAGVRVETINRIENARHTADVATITKIDAALSRRRETGVAGKANRRKPGGKRTRRRAR
jgi:ribosome-binding protein aMBF1 (putative translation factor)